MNKAWPYKLLRWFCPTHLHEEIEGDLIQKFNRDEKIFGERKAKWRLLWNVIGVFSLRILCKSISLTWGKALC
jgi:hypothetical protein